MKPENKVVFSLGDYRIVRTHVQNNKEWYPRLILESKKINALGEVYYSLTIDNPNERGRFTEQNRTYELVNEYSAVLDNLMVLLSEKA